MRCQKIPVTQRILGISKTTDQSPTKFRSMLGTPCVKRQQVDVACWRWLDRSRCCENYNNTGKENKTKLLTEGYWAQPGYRQPTACWGHGNDDRSMGHAEGSWTSLVVLRIIATSMRGKQKNYSWRVLVQKMTTLQTLLPCNLNLMQDTVITEHAGDILTSKNYNR